ncbi:MAG: hypothetical protein H7068_01440 [Pedobacter sp.]|nr:hypothetical protein [Chitinophagaceae bacterium]
MEILNTSIFIKSYVMDNLSSNNLLQPPLEIKNHYIANLVSDSGIMDNNFRDNPARNSAKKAFDIIRALLILGIGVFILFGEKFNVAIVVGLDPILKYIFGSTCLLYGGFRLYRGIKGEDY